MKTIACLLGVVVLVGVIASLPRTSRAADRDAPPLFVTTILPGYRDWKFVSVAHEEGELHDIRVILGNETAINAYRENKLPFPEGAVIARIAWSHVPSDENNKVFGRAQSFVPGPPPDWYLQCMVKDSKKYAATGGWGYGQFDKDSKPADETPLKTCFPCHQKIEARDSVFTHYAP
jgi:cytochrome P460